MAAAGVAEQAEQTAATAAAVDQAERTVAKRADAAEPEEPAAGTPVVAAAAGTPVVAAAVVAAVSLEKVGAMANVIRNRCSRSRICKSLHTKGAPTRRAIVTVTVMTWR